MDWIRAVCPFVIFTLGLTSLANARQEGTSFSPSSPRRPFTFVENAGQADPRVRYIGSGPEFKAWFEDHAVILQNGRTALRMAFAGGVTPGRPSITSAKPLGARASYLHGNDPAHWQTDLPLFGAITYKNVWPGVELDYEAEQSGMKAEYVISPGAEVAAVLLRFDAATEIQNDGSMRVKGPSGDFVEAAPVLYQYVRGERREIPGGFRRGDHHSIGFWAAEYDRSQPLVIDPSILFSGYFGGTSEDNITAVGIDSLNNIVTAGWTNSTNLPASNGARPHYGGGVDAFVASFLPNGGGMTYCTYLGGSGDDRAFGLAIDSARNVYVTGWTSSTNFPLLGPIQTRLSGTRDAFVTKLNSAGNALVYSTYLGGSGVDAGYAVTLDSTSSAIVVGDTTSTNLPVTNAIQSQLGGGQDVFLARLAPSGNSLTVMTYLGGNGLDHGSSVNVGPSGAIFVGGYTWSTNFPTVSPYQPKTGGGQDGFLAKISNTGNILRFSTYLGGSGGSTGAPEEVNAVAIDTLGNIFVAGVTSSPNFPGVAGGFQSTLNGSTNGFVARFNVAGQLVQSTYLGGSANDAINAMTLDFHGSPYVTGTTDSQNFPVQYPLQPGNAGSMDAFVVKMNPTLSAVNFGTYLGGSGSDGGNAIAVDFETSVVVAGQTSSPNLPVAGNLQSYPTEVLSSFISKIAPSFTIGTAYATQGQQTIAVDSWHTASNPQSTIFGLSTDLPIVGDWDGSGKRRIGIFRNGTWIVDINGNGMIDATDKTVQFGQTGDIPVVGDWLGTGHIALGLFRQGTFILDLSGHLSGIPTGQLDASFPWGQGGDIPIAADWNGSGTTKVGIFRNGLWLVDYSGSRVFSSAQSYQYGQAGDIPVVGDWDSSGSPSKIGIYRSGLWVLDYDGDHLWTTPYLTEMVIGFGSAGYIPLIF
jgi:Beta-propeller repeat